MRQNVSNWPECLELRLVKTRYQIRYHINYLAGGGSILKVILVLETRGLVCMKDLINRALCKEILERNPAPEVLNT